MNNTIRSVNDIKYDIKELRETINKKTKGDGYSWEEPIQSRNF